MLDSNMCVRSPLASPFAVFHTPSGCHSSGRWRNRFGASAVRMRLTALRLPLTALQAGNDLRHAEPDFKLHTHVLAFLARQRPAHGDANVLRIQDAHDPGHRRAYRVRPIPSFAQGSGNECFSVHGPSRVTSRRCIVHRGARMTPGKSTLTHVLGQYAPM